MVALSHGGGARLDASLPGNHHRAMRWMRYVQIGFGALFGLVTLFLLVVAIVRFDPDHAGRLFIPLAFGMPGLFVVLMLQAQIRSYRRQDAVVRASIEQCAARVFDAPAPVRPEYDMSVTTTAAMAAYVTAFDSSRGFTTVGEYRGVRVQVASTTPPHQIGTSARTHARHRGQRVGGASR